LQVPARALRAQVGLTWRTRLQASEPRWVGLAFSVPQLDTTRAGNCWARHQPWTPEQRCKRSSPPPGKAPARSAPRCGPHSAGSAGPDAALRTDRRSPSHLSTLTPCWRSSSSPDGRPVRAVRVCAGPLSSPPRTGAAARRHQLVAHPAFVVTKRGPVAVVEFLHHLKSPPPGQHIASDELRGEALGLHGMPSTMQLPHHRRRVKSAPPISW
jgi:hypothetical protein